MAARKSAGLAGASTQLSREEWSRCIATAWAKGVEAFVETGRQLIEAKRALDYGEFLDMVDNDLPFGARTAERLMKIAEHPLLSQSTHASHLPPSWTTLYELSKLPSRKLLTLMKDGTVHPAMERRDAENLIPSEAKPRRPSAIRQLSDALAQTISSMAGAPPPSDAAVVEDQPSLDTSAACSPVTAELKDIERKATEIIEAPVDRLEILLAAWRAAPDDVRFQFLQVIGARLDDGIPDYLRRAPKAAAS